MASKMEQAPARKRSQTAYQWPFPGLVHGISSHLPAHWHPVPPTDPASPKWTLSELPRSGWSKASRAHQTETDHQEPLSIPKPDVSFQEDGSVCPAAWRECLRNKTYSSDYPIHQSANDDLFTPTRMADLQSFGRCSIPEPRGRGGGPVRCMEPAPRLPFSSAEGVQQASEQSLSSQKPGQQGSHPKLQVLARILFLARDGEVQLSALLSQGPESEEDLKKLQKLRRDLLGSYERVILADVQFAEEQKVSEALWRNAFSQVIGRFGQLLQDAGPGKPEPIRESLLQTLEQGIDFFVSLLERLQKKHRFKLEDLPHGAALGHKPVEGPLKSALSCAQKTLICLGDLCRYREQRRGPKHFGKARSWYLKAHQLDPWDSQPCNQLALLALCAKRQVEAVYYFMRGLAAPRSSPCSKENLRQLFEGMKHRAEERERLARSSSSSSSAVCPEGLHRSFTCSFLQAHGRLFTGTGMETFPAVADGVLHKFQLLLRKSPTSIGKHQMLHLMSINMFAVHISQKQRHAERRGSGSQGEATALGLAMLNVLVRCCTSWLQQHPLRGAPGSCPGKENPPPGQVLVSAFGSALSTLLPSVKVCLRWMLLSGPRWSPPPPSCWNPYPDFCQEVRGTLCQFWKSLRGVNTSEVPLFKEPGHGLVPLVLEEDQLLEGFGPFLASPGDPCYLEQNSDRVIAADCRRVHVLRDLLGAFGAHTWDTGELKAKQLILAQQIAEQHQLQEQIRTPQAQKGQMEEEGQPRFLVVDTNYFILHLEHLSKLLERQTYILLVPLIVVFELRGLSKGPKGKREPSLASLQLQQRAGDSIAFLEEQFRLSKSNLRALSPCGKELASIAYQREQLFTEMGNNDDRILSCCLKFRSAKTRKKGPSRKKQLKGTRLHAGDLALLTEDIALQLKARAYNVPVWDKKKFLKVKQMLWTGHRRQHRRQPGHSHPQHPQRAVRRHQTCKL